MRKLFLILTLGCLLWGAVLPAGADGEPACAKTAGCTLADGHEGLCNALCDDTSGCVLYGGHEGSCVTELVLDEDADIDEVLAEKDTLVAYLEGKYPGYQDHACQNILILFSGGQVQACINRDQYQTKQA